MIRSAVSVVALAALSTVPALAAPTTLVATLDAANEPDGGDAKGSGTFTVEVDPDAGDFCYTLKQKGLVPTMAHVHTGAVGVSGPPVVTIAVADDECVAVEPDVLRPIVANPEGYYVNIHTAAFPKGAVRGQLKKK